MGDPLKKVQPGQPVRIPARTFNTFIDAAQDYLQRRQNVGGRPLGTRPRSGIILTKNASGADLEQFNILGVDSVIFTPTDNADEFRARAALSGITPADAHIGRFVILLEPVADGKIGHAIVQGIVPVRLYVTHANHTHAEIEPGTAAYLSSQWAGTARIYWKEAGVSSDTEDLKWGLVVLPVGGGIGASYVWRARVTGVYGWDGAAWVSYADDGWQCYATANPLYQNGEPDEDTTLYLKLTRDCADGEVGFKDVGIGDDLGYVIATDTADVPGQPEGTGYNGWVLLHGGDEGAMLSALQHVQGGPGIVVDETDPFDPKASVQLADVTPPGLQFVDGAGDEGKLAVKPDTAKGIDVGANGVCVDLAADPGLQFVGGDLAVKPNAAKAVVVEAAGVGVVANADKAIVAEVAGVGVVANIPEAIAVDADGVRWAYNTEKGLDTENNLAIVKVDPLRAVGVDADGIHLMFGYGLDLDEGAVVVALYTEGTGGPHLEFVTGELAHKTLHDSDQWITVGDGAGGTITLIFDRAGHFTGTYP
ncbi:MAG TPA: hypothetical protein VM238_13445 [Phycisphaerae bacterium]|nr:hypothetical protein [Phycisphaerae bacterium]